MNCYTFHKDDGSEYCTVNMDRLDIATPVSDTKTMLQVGGLSVTVSTEEFRKAVSVKKDKMNEVTSIVNRLIQAMDRMTLHFPTSIRMHL